MQEMKYFNEGNDCDICKNQLMTGRDGTVEDCRRRQNGLSCRFEERDIRTCPVCEHEVDREDMYFTKDCHEEEINYKMLTDEEQDDGFYYKYNEKVLFRTDSKTQMEYLKNGVSGSIMKPNEARRKLDLPDGEGGDTLLANGSIVPLTMAGAAYQKGQIEQEETEKPEQPEEETEPDTEQPDTTGQPDETDEAEDEEEQEGGE